MNFSYTAIKEKLISGFVYLTFGWVIFALMFQCLFIFLHFTNEKKASELANEISWRIDGTFKNSPENIWYNGKQ